MSFYCSSNMYNLKLLYMYKHNNFNSLIYDGNFFNNEECDFKLNIVVGM